jgi:hypothetical protein
MDAQTTARPTAARYVLKNIHDGTFKKTEAEKEN